MMTEQKFATLVRRLERYAREQPRAYQAHVGLLAALGYVYIFGVILLLLALIVALVAGAIGLIVAVATHPGGGAGAVGLFKLLIPLGLGLIAVVGAVARSFRVHFPAPEGFALDHRTAPRLYAALDQICATLKAPRFDHVLVDDDFNAGVMQKPRFGLFGGQVNYLVLGLPYMEAVTPEQFRATLAHEIGHLSRNHSRFSGWIYRVRQTWNQMLTSLLREQQGGLSLFLPFFRWYSPYFAAYSFVLSRGDEYVADRCAAEVCGAEVCAQSLIATMVKSAAYGHDFWGKLLEKARTEPQIPEDLYVYLQRSLRSASDKDEQRYEDALEERTGLGDTHPSLADRLASLGFRMVPGGPLDLPKPPLPLPAPPVETAADAYLGDLRHQIVPPMNAQWRQNIADAWVAQNREFREQQQKLDGLDRQAAEQGLTASELWERARLTGAVYGETQALPLVRAVLQAQPDHVAANFVFGKTLLKQKDPRGLPFVQKAIATAPEAVGPGCDVIYQFLRGQGRLKEAAPYRERARKHEREWEAGQGERAGVGLSDKFIYHGLDAETLHGLQSQIAQMPMILRAYFVRKQVKYLPDIPLYVLGLVPDTRSVAPNGAGMRELVDWLGPKLELPGETVLIILAAETKRLEKPLAQMASALIFSR